jgi:hypothetical protein
LPDEALEKFENEQDEKYEHSIRPWKELFRESLIVELTRRQKNNEPIDMAPVKTKPYEIYLHFFLFLDFYFQSIEIFERQSDRQTLGILISFLLIHISVAFVCFLNKSDSPNKLI